MGKGSIEIWIKLWNGSGRDSYMKQHNVLGRGWSLNFVFSEVIFIVLCILFFFCIHNQNPLTGYIARSHVTQNCCGYSMLEFL